MTTEVRAPASGARLGTLAPVDLAAAAAAALDAQPLWSLVPARARARYVGRAAVAMLDELDGLATALADETGWPRTQLMLSELLPAVRGLRALAGEGPAVLADRRTSPWAARLAGRRTRMLQAPVGVIGLRGPSASPWAEPALEAAAALLAGNGVLLAAGAPLAMGRLRAIFLRAGVPGELLAAVPEPAGELAALSRRVLDLPAPNRRGTLLVLNGADRARVIEAALWAAFGRHTAAAGRLVVTPGAAPGLLEALAAAAGRLRVGDPRDPATDVGPLASLTDLAAVEAALAGADVRGGGRIRVHGLAGAFWAPAVVAGAGPADALYRDPPPGPVLTVVEVADSEAAIGLAGRDGPVSIWARDPQQAERVARRLPCPVTWIGRHGVAAEPAAARLTRHVAPRRLETRAPWAPGTAHLPEDADFVAAQSTLAEARHGREARRWPVLRAGAGALVRTARRT